MQNNTQSPQVILKILWGALLGSHFIYLFALYTISKNYEGAKGLDNPMMLPMMASAAVVAYALGFFLFKTLLNAEKNKRQNLSQDEMATLYLPPMIVRLALFEGAAIMGFALSFLSHDLNYYLVPLSLNIILFAVNFPSDQKVKEAFTI